MALPASVYAVGALTVLVFNMAWIDILLFHQGPLTLLLAFTIRFNLPYNGLSAKL